VCSRNTIQTLVDKVYYCLEILQEFTTRFSDFEKQLRRLCFPGDLGVHLMESKDEDEQTHQQDPEQEEPLGAAVSGGVLRRDQDGLLLL
jgi:hypothetical protein